MTVAISGRITIAAEARSSAVAPIEQDMLMTASHRERMAGRKPCHTAGSLVGRPSCGSRAWKCRMAAPALAASTDCSIICSAVTGRCGDIDGDRVEPVTAQVMMTFLDFATGDPPDDALRWARRLAPPAR